MRGAARPPAHVLAGAERLDPGGFQREFGTAWRNMRHRFLEVECRQSYQEPGTPSVVAALAGDSKRARELLPAEVEAERHLYVDVRERGIDYCRIRVVRLPMTPYLAWEMVVYAARAADIGETIVIVDRTEDDTPLPNEHVFDFLLFDRSVALVHDYGTKGLQDGGWLVHSPGVLAHLERIATDLRAEAVPLDEFRVLARTDEGVSATYVR